MLMAALLAANVYVALAISPDLTEILLNGGYTLVASWPLPPFLIEVMRLEGLVAAASYWAVLGILVLSFTTLLFRSRTFMQELGGKISERPSPLYAVVTLFCALLLFDIVYYLLLGQYGIQPGTPFTMDPNDQRLLFSLLHAVVWEEINDRLLFIGLPIALLILAGRREGSPLKALLGGTGVGRAEIILIFLSSAVFALSHLPAWDEWKLLPTFLSGLGMGYLFVRYGLYASIMLHFCFNYLTAVPLYTGSFPLELLIGLFILLLVFVGIPYMIKYSRAGVVTMYRVLRHGVNCDESKDRQGF